MRRGFFKWVPVSQLFHRSFCFAHLPVALMWFLPFDGRLYETYFSAGMLWLKATTDYIRLACFSGYNTIICLPLPLDKLVFTGIALQTYLLHRFAILLLRVLPL